jgi:hypothetical protein
MHDIMLNDMLQTNIFLIGLELEHCHEIGHQIFYFESGIVCAKLIFLNLGYILEI